MHIFLPKTDCTNKELYKKAKHNTLKLITAKKTKHFLMINIFSEYILNPKELWETLKSLSMAKKKH